MKSEIIQRILTSIILIPVALFFIVKGSYFFTFFMITFFIVATYEWIGISIIELNNLLKNSFFIKYFQNFF